MALCRADVWAKGIMGRPGEVGDGELSLGGESSAARVAFIAASAAGGCGL